MAEGSPPASKPSSANDYCASWLQRSIEERRLNSIRRSRRDQAVSPAGGARRATKTKVRGLTPQVLTEDEPGHGCVRVIRPDSGAWSQSEGVWHIGSTTGGDAQERTIVTGSLGSIAPSNGRSRQLDSTSRSAYIPVRNFSVPWPACRQPFKKRLHDHLVPPLGDAGFLPTGPRTLVYAKLLRCLFDRPTICAPHCSELV